MRKNELYDAIGRLTTDDYIEIGRVYGCMPDVFKNVINADGSEYEFTGEFDSPPIGQLVYVPYGRALKNEITPGTSSSRKLFFMREAEKRYRYITEGRGIPKAGDWVNLIWDGGRPSEFHIFDEYVKSLSVGSSDGKCWIYRREEIKD